MHGVAGRVGACTGVAAGVPAAYLVLSLMARAVVPGAVGASIAADVAAAAIVAVLLMRDRRGVLRTPGGRTERMPSLMWGSAGLGVLAFAAGQSAGLLAYRLTASPGWTARTAAEASAPAWLVVVFSVAVAPAAEEAMLRGVMYPILRRWSPVWVSVAVTTGVFAALHANIVQSTAVVPLGIVLGVLRERGGRLWPAVVVHAGFNAAALVVPPVWLAGLAGPLPVALLAVVFALATAALALRTAPSGRTEGRAVDARPTEPVGAGRDDGWPGNRPPGEKRRRSNDDGGRTS